VQFDAPDMRATIALLVGILALGTGAAAAQAATTVIRLTPHESLVAAGGGHVVAVVQRGGQTPAIVERIDPNGRRTPLVTIAAPADDETFINITGLAVTPTMWVVAMHYQQEQNSEGDDHKPDLDIGEQILSGPIGGGPATTLLSCTTSAAVDDRDAETPELAVSDARVAWSESHCPGADGVRVAPITGGPSVAVAPTGIALGLTPASVVFLNPTNPAVRTGVMSQVDLTTGAVITTNTETDTLDTVAAGDDGLVVAAENATCPDKCPPSLTRIAADGAPVQPGLATIDPYLGLVVGGGRALSGRDNDDGLVAVDLATGQRSYTQSLGLSSHAMIPLAVDAHQATYLGYDCAANADVRIEDTVSTPQRPLRTVPCPVRFRSAITYDSFTGEGRLRVSCPKGCASEWNLTLHGRHLGTVALSEQPGRTGTASIDVTRPKLLAHTHDATVTASLAESDFPFARQQAAVRLALHVR
jgi:hypothetical protein